MTGEAYPVPRRRFWQRRRHTAPPPPKPLVASKLRHPLKWTLQVAAIVIAAVIGAHLGKFDVAAVYYLVVEGAGHPWWLTGEWHHLIGAHGVLIGSRGPLPGGDADRHMIRNVFEGLYGGLLGVMLAWNAYKPSYVKKCAQPLTWLDNIEFKLRIPNVKDKRRLSPAQLVATPLWVLVYAIPGLAVAYGLQKLIDAIWHSTAFLSFGASHSWATQLYTGQWYPILAGLFASYFMGKRPVFKVANDVQLWFAERRVSRAETLRVPVERLWRWYDTAAFKARVTDVQSRMRRGEERRSTISRGGAVGAAMIGVWVLVLGFAGYGAYVLTQIATKAHG